MLERSRRLYQFAPQTHSRHALWLLALASLFLGFAAYARHGFMAAYLAAFGVVLILGAAFSVINSRKIAKLAAGDPH